MTKEEEKAFKAHARELGIKYDNVKHLIDMTDDERDKYFKDYKEVIESSNKFQKLIENDKDFRAALLQELTGDDYEKSIWGEDFPPNTEEEAEAIDPEMLRLYEKYPNASYKDFAYNDELWDYHYEDPKKREKRLKGLDKLTLQGTTKYELLEALAEPFDLSSGVFKDTREALKDKFSRNPDSIYDSLLFRRKLEDVDKLKNSWDIWEKNPLEERTSKIGANMIKNIGPKGENNDRGVDTNNETIDGVSEETTRDNTADATTIDNTPDRVDETFENVTPEEVEQAIEENPEGALIHEDITPTDVDTEIEQAVDEGGRNDEVRNDVVETFVEKEPEKAEEFVTKTREEQQEESRKWAEEQKAKHVPVEETNTNPFEGLSDDEREYLNNLTDNIINEYYGPKTKPEPVDIDAFNKQVDEDLEAINNLDNFGSLDEPYSKKEEKERKQREKEYNKAAKEAFEEEVGSTGSKAKHDAKEALEKEVDDAISREEGQRVEQPASPNKSFEQYNAEMDTDAAYDDMIQERDEMRDEEFEDYLRNVPDNLDDLTDFSHPEEEPIDIQEEEKPKKEFTLPKVTLHGGMDTIQSSAPFHDTIDMQEATQTGSTGFSGHGNVSVPSAGSGNVHAGHSRAAPGSNWVPHHDTPIMGTATLPTSNPASPTSHVQPISSNDGIGGTASNVSIPNKNGDFAVNKTGPQGGFTGHTSTPIQVAPIGGGSANKGMLNGMNVRASLIVGIEEKIKSKDPSELEKIGIGHRYKHFDWNGISIDELSGQQLNKLAQLLDEI